jgi:hypothetical protein
LLYGIVNELYISHIQYRHLIFIKSGLYLGTFC